jgi:hypothetical protein
MKIRIPRDVIEKLARELPADFAGSIIIELHVNQGEVGKVAVTTKRWTTWADWCAMAHGRPLPTRVLGEANWLEAERIYDISKEDAR